MISRAILLATLLLPCVAQAQAVDQSSVPTTVDIALSFPPYAHALAALAGWAVLMLVLIPISVIGAPRARTESGHPVRDYSDPFYRRGRAFQNAVEICGPFVAAAVAAILVGASPFWVNLLASVFLVSRIAMAVVHIATEIQPLRSALWSVGLLCCIALALMAFFGALGM